MNKNMIDIQTFLEEILGKDSGPGGRNPTNI